MKKLLPFLLVAFMPMLLNAQSPPRQALRVGGGVDIASSNLPDQWHYGPVYSVDYQYVLSKHFDINLNFMISDSGENGIDYYYGIKSYSPALRLMITPLPANRFFQVGVGLHYYINDYTSEPNVFIDDDCFFGIDIPIRFYLIDSNKFQLFVDYVGSLQPRYGVQGRFFGYNAHRFSLYFGVKF